MIILDTSAIIEILKGTEAGRKINQLTLNNETAITAFSTHELLVGARASEIPQLYGFLASLEAWGFDSASALESSRIKKELSGKGKSIGDIDIFIAGICMSNNAKLITLDKDFEPIEGLNVVVL
jgi:predicted nucleic acid-binding protein